MKPSTEPQCENNSEDASNDHDPNSFEMKRMSGRGYTAYLGGGYDTIVLCEKPQFNTRFFLICVAFLTISVLLGPFSLYIYKMFKHGTTIARNIEILDNNGNYKQKFTYILRVFAVVVSFVYTFNQVQLFVLIYTEVSLIIVYSAFFSVKKPSEVKDMLAKRVNTNYDQDELNIAKRYFREAQRSKSKFFDLGNLQRDFKDIDVSSFYFYSLDSSITFRNWRMSVYMTPRHQGPTQPFFPSDLSRNVSQFDGLSYTENVLRMCEYTVERFAFNTRIARILSRLIVLIRFLGPFATDLLMTTAPIYLTVVDEFIYLFQSIFYFYLIYRCSIVYDVLFYGIIVYIQKWRVLSQLQSFLYQDHEKLKNKFPNPHFVIPENIMSWYFMRKLCNSIFREFYIIVNVVLSYMIVYLVLAFLQLVYEFATGETLQVFKDKASQQVFEAISSTFTFVLILILMVSIVLIVEINKFHDSHAYMLGKQLHTFEVIRNMESDYIKFLSSEESSDMKSYEEGTYDEYRRVLQIFKQAYGEMYCLENYEKHMKLVTRTLKSVIHDLQEEFRMYPHTILGLSVDYVLLIRTYSAFSLIGIGKLRQLFKV